MAYDAQLVEKLYRGFNSRDIEAVLADLSENVAWANGMDGGHVPRSRGGQGVLDATMGGDRPPAWNPCKSTSVETDPQRSRFIKLLKISKASCCSMKR